MSEADIQEEIVHLLRSYGKPNVAWCAVANGEQRSPSVGARLKRQGVIAGAPDIILCVKGQYYGLELKTEKGTVSEAQYIFGNWIQSAGGTYAICYGKEDAAHYLKAIGAIKDNVTISSSRAMSRSPVMNKLNRGSAKKEK